jgi:type IV pilus assembly protein PilB
VQVYDNQALYGALKELEVIPSADLDKVLADIKVSGQPLGDALLKKDLIADENLGKVIADTIKVPFVNLAKEAIGDDLLIVVPEVLARKKKLIAFGRDNSGLKLAMTNPVDHELIDFIAKKTGENITVYFATDRDIENAMRFYQKEMQKTFNDLLAEQVEVAGKSAAKEAPVSKIVDLLIEYAYQNKASDIHIEPEEKQSLVRFRMDGILHDVLRLPFDLHNQLVSRVKVLSKLRTDEHMSAQDGKLQVRLELEKLDIRVSIIPIVGGEKVVLRLLSSSSRQFSLNNLGMSEENIKKVKEGFLKPFGMVLSTGPTGSGKTTTIYSILKIINSREKNIATIEDPVEYDIEGLNQIQVNPKTNLTFADGLRSILRQDPDVIFVGEIRDFETAGIAVNAAMTGHLVLSTLHTNNASTTLPRLIDMKVEPFLVASTVNVIIGQRLIRRICEKCRYSTSVKFETLSKMFPANVLAKLVAEKGDLRIYQGKGCAVCHETGYVGRVGIFELLVMSNAIRQLITTKASAEQINQQAIREGMTTMLEDGLSKVKQGITTIDEVLRATSL